jgi:hypothetical protein
MKRFWGVCVLLHGLTPIVFAFHVLVVFKFFPENRSSFFSVGSMTHGYGLASALVGLWGLTGMFLYSMYFGAIKRSTLVCSCAFFAFAIIYIEILRERLGFVDVNDYVLAAKNILDKKPFHARYIYPPMLASFLAMLWSAGKGNVLPTFVCFMANMFSMWAFFAFCVVLLRKLGCSLDLAALVTFAVLTINVPVLTNLGDIQVNLLVMDLVLASVLTFERRPVLSGFLLAIGVHLKVIPIIFAPLFLLRPNVKWIVSFVATGLLVVVLTSLKDGMNYYHGFLENLNEWNGTYSVKRSSSIHSLVKMTKSAFATGNHKRARRFLKFIDMGLRVGLAAWILALSWISARKKTFFRSGSNTENLILNACMPLFFLPIASIQGLVLPYHLTFIIPSFLALVVMVHSKRSAILFGIAYYLVFIVPTFDIYPWTAIRAVGWLLSLVMMTLAIRRDWRPDWPATANKRLDLALDAMIHGEARTAGTP